MCWKATKGKKQKKEKKEIKVARYHPAVSNCGKNKVTPPFRSRCFCEFSTRCMHEIDNPYRVSVFYS